MPPTPENIRLTGKGRGATGKNGKEVLTLSKCYLCVIYGKDKRKRLQFLTVTHCFNWCARLDSNQRPTA